MIIKRLAVGTVLLAGLTMFVDTPAFARVKRIIDDNNRITLRGNVHPQARPESNVGATDRSLPMERMILNLQRDPVKQTELDKFIAEQQDPTSPDYHRWLSPEEFGERFGLADDDIEEITDWLTSKGFTIDEVGKGRTWINFSGKVSHVESAFRTKMHDYKVDGKLRHANTQDPSIPRALADMVTGVVSLHNFPLKAMNTRAKPLATGTVQPNFTNWDGNHYLAPSDFATIYNVTPLYNAGINGTGTSIAIVGRTNPSTNNWAIFRSQMGLPNNPPQVIVNGPDPGDQGAGENIEADLDVEWAGAVAKNATIYFVTSKTTATTDGVHLSAQYIVNNNLASVMSTSFGLCESYLGTSENAFYNNLWAQAAAQGITSFVASGDWGAAGCIVKDIFGNMVSQALGVNGLASTPNNVAVGGTQFNEGGGNYWNTTNNGWASAISYIPEIAWNEGAEATTGGGSSLLYSKPLWQVGSGVPNDGKRDIPDVSLTAAGHDGYLVYSGSGTLYAIGGTSASSPSFAGLMALIVQKTGQRQGNANPKFYQLGYSQYGLGGVSVFHDTQTGNNSVPGVTGYTAGVGYDLATGLGSVDANALIWNWPGPGGSYPATLSGGGNFDVSIGYGTDDSGRIITSPSQFPYTPWGYIATSPFPGSISIGYGTDDSGRIITSPSQSPYTPWGYIATSPFPGSISIGYGTDDSGRIITSPSQSPYTPWGYIATSLGTYGAIYSCPFGGTLSGTTCYR